MDNIKQWHQKQHFLEILRNYVQPDDPNMVGEALRSWAFVGGYGCYSSFDLREGFRVQRVTEREFQFLIGRESGCVEEYWGWDDADVFKRAAWYRHENGIEVGWYWDGDGTLVFFVPSENRVYRNTDCKKSDYWDYEGLDD